MVPEMSQPITQTNLPSQKIEPSRLAHLAPEQRHELLTLLTSLETVFLMFHSRFLPIRRTYSSSNKQFRSKTTRSIQDTVQLRADVQRQLQELEQLGIIRQSKSPMASPVICVLKGKDGKEGVRLAIDYKYVNKFTVSDAYPTPDLADIVQEVGES